MALIDDEQDVPSANLSAGPKSAERVRLEASISKWAPLKETRLQVMLKLIVASSSAGHRFGLDLVVVLDVSGEKLAKMRAAMHFIISKLSHVDRLCIVGTTERLQFMTKATRAELRGTVDGLVARGSTDMSDGLQTGLDVLADGRLGGARIASVLLMSDCKQHPRVVETSKVAVAVHTFCFGQDQDHDCTVLEKIASDSHGGMFNFVRDDEENLSAPISQILAGLLSVVVQDLKLTMWTEPGYGGVKPTIEKVDAGSYRKAEKIAESREDRKVTVSLGDLYSGEDRKVIVDLLLPTVGWGSNATIINAGISYSTQREAFDSPEAFNIKRSSNTPVRVPPALKAELVRRRHADMLREASTMGYAGAQGKLAEAWQALEAEKPHPRSLGEKPKPHPMIGILKGELDTFVKLQKWVELHACLLAAIMSHCRQRFASRGDIMNVRLFDTPLMRMYLVQAHKFDDDPAMQPPSADEDVEEEEEKQRPVVAGQRPRFGGGLRIRERRISWWDWVVMIRWMVLAIGAILASAAVLAMFLLYKPKMPYLVVSDAQLGQLRYRQDGTIQSLRVSITILAKNNNSKVDASFSRVHIALGFHGADVALLRAEPFVVARESSIALHYHVVSAGPVLDAARMNESLKVGLVPLDLFSTARTRWKAGIFIKLTFSTRISCRLRFFFPGNGTVMPMDRDRCRSRSP